MGFSLQFSNCLETKNLLKIIPSWYNGKIESPLKCSLKKNWPSGTC